MITMTDVPLLLAMNSLLVILVGFLVAAVYQRLKDIERKIDRLKQETL